jgi:uncharacterized protein
MSAAADLRARLESVLAGHGPLAIAVSGGVDSMTLAVLAHRFGDVEIVHAVSPAVPREATARVRAYADREGWRLAVTQAGEFDDENYLANPVDRCFFCKSNLYDRIAGLSTRRIASGANLDDLGEYRPGLIAAARHRVVHPLVEAGIDKAGVRSLARAHRLDDLAELPAQPCLSSRIETGIAIGVDDLAFVHRIESRVREIVGGGGDIRCRVTQKGIVLELPSDCSAAARQAAADVASRLAAESGRVFAETRPYRRGAAFLTQGR